MSGVTIKKLPPTVNLFSKKNLHRAEWTVALTITAAAVLLHFFSMSVAGGLWRDEVVTVNVALLPTWMDTIRALIYDSFPGVFHAVIRVWAALGLAHSDAGLRVLGLCVGLFLLASFWAASRMMGKTPPLFLLSFAALNPVVIRYGDSMRSYGLGIALMTLTTGLMWRFIVKPGWRRGLLAGVFAVASVQTLYQNAFFLLAIGLAGVVVSLRQHQYLKSIGILSIGFVAALSLVPYVKPIHDTQDSWLLFKYGINFSRCWDLLSQLAGDFLGVWLGLVVLTAVFGTRRIFLKTLQEETDRQPDLPLFGGVAIVLGVSGFGVFVKLSGLPTQVWYYIPVLCFTMMCCDSVFSRVHSFTRTGVLVMALLALVFSPSAYSSLRWRQTNGDLIAAQVSKAATADDYIIVNTWYYGVTFARYYNGAAKWTTLPSISDYRFQRYDLMKEKLQTPNAIAPVLDQVKATLQSGHRIWIVGKISTPPLGSPMPDDLPIAPNDQTGWLDAPYYAVWEKQLGWYLQNHAAKVTSYVTETNSIAVNPLENMSLTAFRGWDTNAPDAGR
jgi:hypothetical protein